MHHIEEKHIIYSSNSGVQTVPFRNRSNYSIIAQHQDDYEMKFEVLHQASATTTAG